MNEVRERKILHPNIGNPSFGETLTSLGSVCTASVIENQGPSGWDGTVGGFAASSPPYGGKKIDNSQLKTNRVTVRLYSSTKKISFFFRKSTSFFPL